MAQHTPHEAVVNDPKALPVMLPGKLIGREAVLAAIYAQLKANKPVLIYGQPGVGKTALAATLATAYAQQPGGVLWMNVDHPPLDELLVRVGRAYNVAEITNTDTPLGMVGAVENTLRSNKPFIVIDGAVEAGVLSRFISRCADGLPMIIAVEDEHIGLWETIAIEPLDQNGAAALFKREGRVAVNEPDDTIFEIVEQVEHLPYSLIVSARAMVASKQPPATFLNTLKQITASGEVGTRAGLTVSFRALNGALQGLVLMMGAIFDGSASPELLHMVSGAPVASVKQAMDILTQLHIVSRTMRYGEHYYAMHTITHAFAQSYLEKAGKLDGLRQKVKAAIINYAKQNSLPADYDKLAAEIDTFVNLAAWSIEHDDQETADALADILNSADDFVRERGYVYEIVQMREAKKRATGAFPAYDPEPLPELPLDDEEDFPEDSSEYEIDEDALELVDEDDSAEVAVAASPEDMLTGTPATSDDLSTMDEAQLRAMLGQERQSGNQDRQIEILKAIATRQVDNDMENEAISTYTEILNVNEDQDDEQGTLETLEMLAALMVKTDNAQAAVMHAQRAVNLAQELDDDQTLMQVYMMLGDARQQLGESTQAISDYTEALAIARKNDDTQHEAIILFKLGYAQLDDGDADTAVETFEQARELFKGQGKRAYEGRVMGGLGSAYGDLERWAEAVSLHTSAFYVAREVGDKDEEALQLSSLAYAAVQANQLGDAVLRYRQALHLAFMSNDKDNIVSLLVDLARLLLQSRSYAAIAGMLADTAAEYEPNSKDVVQLKDRVNSEKSLAEQYGKKLKPVKGDARTYAQNAYGMLDS